MAVGKYRRRYLAKNITIFIAVQLLIAASIWGWLLGGANHINTTNPEALGIGLFILLEIAASFILVKIASKPIEELGEAVEYAYRESSDTKTDDLFNLTQAIRRLAANRESEAGTITTEHAFASSLLDHLPIGVIVLNAKQKVIYANSTAPTYGGGKEINLNFSEHDSLDSWLKKVGGNLMTASHWWKRVREAHPKNEESRQFYDVFSMYNQDNADSIETVIITINRTAEYATDEDDLDFTALAAHELRGPITVIKGYLDVLRQELDKELSDDQKAFFERLDVSADRLSTYINNILNVSRYDRRHLQISLREETLAKIYASVADDLDLRARTHHRILNVDLPKSLPTIAGDRGSLSEVIVNLVDNAIKYSFEGGIVVVAAEVKGDFVEVSVKDTGIGIPGSLISHVFDKFYRSHRSRENTVGTGLGLYITKGIIESHGGAIVARSEEGHGSTFAFTLPIYATVADKLKADDNSNEAMIKPKKYIKNHSMYRG